MVSRGAGQKVLIRGCGDVGSAVAHALFGAGYRVVMHSGVRVEQGTKVVEIDPRGADADIYGIGERPRRIAEGVISAIRNARSH